MSYQQNHYKKHLTWNIHGLVDGPLLIWAPYITKTKYTYYQNIEWKMETVGSFQKLVNLFLTTEYYNQHNCVFRK
jgi:hypothetical protein